MLQSVHTLATKNDSKTIKICKLLQTAPLKPSWKAVFYYLLQLKVWGLFHLWPHPALLMMWLGVVRSMLFCTWKPHPTVTPLVRHTYTRGCCYPPCLFSSTHMVRNMVVPQSRFLSEYFSSLSFLKTRIRVYQHIYIYKHITRILVRM